MTISFNPKLTNLDGFDSLLMIEKDIAIDRLDNIQSIKALNRLNEVKGTITIRDIALPSLTFLANLEKTNSLILENNKHLLDLSHLNNLRECGTVTINSNPALVNLKGFNPILIDKLSIDSNHALKEIKCFANISSIRTLTINNNLLLNSILNDGAPITFKTLKIQNQPNLLTLNEFNILEVLIELKIDNNARLEEVKSINRLIGLNGLNIFTNNPKLVSLNFDSLKRTSFTSSITISNNILLREVIIPKYENFDLNDLTIESNPKLVMFSAPRVLRVENIIIVDNKELEFLDMFRDLNTIYVLLNISNNDKLQDLDFLKLVYSIGEVRIINNGSLQNLNFFDNLTKILTLKIINNANIIELFSTDSKFKKVSKECSIINNDLLKKIDFANKLDIIKILNIEENLLLENINLGKIEPISTIKITISNNPNLTKIEVGQISKISSLTLSKNYKLKDIGGYNQIDSVGELIIENNPELENLSGLSTLTQVFNLIIRKNEKIRSLKELKNFKYITGNLDINSNNSLIELFNDLYLVQGNINIISNPILKDISGLRHIGTFSSFLLLNNPSLSKICN